MGTQKLAQKAVTSPTFFENMDDFFKPWNEWFGNTSRRATLPAVNIIENHGDFEVTLAAPGMKKADFKIAIDNNILTISSELEESENGEARKFTRKEYSYSSFSRSFTIPEEVNKENIEARYEDGVLRLLLPMKDHIKGPLAKHVALESASGFIG